MPRCDGLEACRRRVGDPSHFAQYVVGLDEKTGFKSIAPQWRDRRGNWEEVEKLHRAFDNEAEFLRIATQHNAPTPKFLGYNPRTRVIKMQHLGHYDSLHRSKLDVDFSKNRVVAGKFLRAMEELHIAGIVHTDPHLGNVMIHRVTGDVKLIDLNTAMSMKWSRQEAVAKDTLKRSLSGGEALQREIYKLWIRLGIPRGNSSNAISRKYQNDFINVARLSYPDRKDMFTSFYNDFRKLLMDPATFYVPKPPTLITTPSQDLAAIEAIARQNQRMGQG